MSHKKIMKKCASKLMADAKHYDKEIKDSKGVKKKHEKTEALMMAKALKKGAKKAHEY